MNKIILGFDVGSHKIGVAVGQTMLQQAQPLKRLLVHQGLPNATEIKKLILEWTPNILVVGVPLKMDGAPQFTTVLAENFIAFLKTVTSQPIYEVDERLTTKIARSELYDQGGFKKLKNADIDSYAAKLIIESWMIEHSKVGVT